MNDTANSLFGLTGKNAVVTGGAKGIGREVVDTLSAFGAEVVYGDVSIGPDEQEHPAGRTPGTVLGTHCDVSDPAGVDAFARTVANRFDAVDILVNCAGIGGHDRPFGEIDLAEWDRMLDVNLKGTFLVTRAFHPGMIARRSGRIVNFASQLAYKGAPGLAHYCAAKAGTVGLTRALALESAPFNVLVNAVAPGPVETDLLMSHSDAWLANKRNELPIGRFGQTSEVAATVLLLCSPAGSYYSGQTLSPNGGDVAL